MRTVKQVDKDIAYMEEQAKIAKEEGMCFSFSAYQAILTQLHEERDLLCPREAKIKKPRLLLDFIPIAKGDVKVIPIKYDMIHEYFLPLYAAIEKKYENLV